MPAAAGLWCTALLGGDRVWLQAVLHLDMRRMLGENGEQGRHSCFACRDLSKAQDFLSKQYALAID